MNYSHNTHRDRLIVEIYLFIYTHTERFLTKETLAREKSEEPEQYFRY